MTKEEITNKANSYKHELNNCNVNIDKFDSSINSCNKLKKYFMSKTPEKQKLSNLCLTLGVLILPLSIFYVITLPILGTILLASSIVSFERHFFFKNVTKKFKHCENFFGKITKYLTDKKLNYLIQKEHALQEIYKLENEIPEEVIEAISMIPEEEISKLTENSIFEKCIERTSKTTEEINTL